MKKSFLPLFVSALVLAPAALRAQDPAAAPTPAPAMEPVAPAAPDAPSSSPAPAPTPATAPETPAAVASDAPVPEKAGGGESAGPSFSTGVSFGTVTMDGKTWTRLSVQPELAIGKLGVAFDLELFLDENQNFATRGWEFDTKEKALESVLRKIYYVRWDKPGAPFYARLGAIDRVDLGYGLVMRAYNNTARYPDYKLLGLHSQLNDLTSLGLDAEVLVNSFQDFQRGGALVAGRVGFRPIKAMGIPVFSGLKVGAGAARDFSQFAGLRDRDDDGCPDLVEEDFADNADRCRPSYAADPEVIQALRNENRLPDPSTVTGTQLIQSLDSLRKVDEKAVADKYSQEKPVTIVWVDAMQPIIETRLFGLNVYAAAAKPFGDEDSLDYDGWAAILPGAGARLGPIQATLEYRMQQAPFEMGYFNEKYEIERARMVAGEVRTKDQLVFGSGESGFMQGIFGGLKADILKFLEVSGSYSHMVSSKSSEEDLITASARAGLGQNVVSLVPKLKAAEVFWRKDRIGLDKTGDDLDGDDFFENSIFASYGWRVGWEVAPSVTLLMQRETTFLRAEDGSLEAQNNMTIQSAMAF